MQFCRHAPPWVCQILACVGGCIGYSTIPPEHKVKEDKRSEDLSSSCAFEMDQSAAQSLGTIPSTGTPNQPPSAPQTSADPQSDHPVFVNHGLILWNQTREQWLQRRRSESRPQVSQPRIRKWLTFLSMFGMKRVCMAEQPKHGSLIDFKKRKSKIYVTRCGFSSANSYSENVKTYRFKFNQTRVKSERKPRQTGLHL
ncbi:uncharacterized protein LOC114735736 isoform X2 [Neltuma alba]|uniref:uncharacterized protein LOC114735736 isoform X2 n=1 Tax=Neltuma alba TaxID=207710 RepID=UPI0010A5975A|nr:uncharacterized protein LOC114735736 isoform X2 [Prosopis alba]XP_028779298.1 uncharacterized protein LOC114735736 isoform X2 [Prosopis alba]